MNISRINYYLKERNMTQVELAKRLGVTRSAVNLWCMGKNVPRLPLLLKVADVLRCDAEDLFVFEDENGKEEV